MISCIFWGAIGQGLYYSIRWNTIDGDGAWIAAFCLRVWNGTCQLELDMSFGFWSRNGTGNSGYQN